MCHFYLVYKVIPNACQCLHPTWGAPYVLQLSTARLGMILSKHPLESFSIQAVGTLFIHEYSKFITLLNTAEVQFWFLVAHCEGCNKLYFSAVYVMGLVKSINKHWLRFASIIWITLSLWILGTPGVFSSMTSVTWVHLSGAKPFWKGMVIILQWTSVIFTLCGCFIMSNVSTWGRRGLLFWDSIKCFCEHRKCDFCSADCISGSRKKF